MNEEELKIFKKEMQAELIAAQNKLDNLAPLNPRKLKDFSTMTGFNASCPVRRELNIKIKRIKEKIKWIDEKLATL
jgi:hypothetical protein